MKISNLLILGETGVGKSYGTLCLTTEIIKKGYSASVLTAFEMTNLFLKYHTTIDAEKIEALSPILDPDLLVIDDLGTEPILKNVTLEYLYLIIAERMNKQKLTVITSNLSLSNILDRYGERIFSRLNNKELSAVIKLQGDDLRLKI
ncbi:MAG: ATP-binding protein [Clostridia bacterium]